MGTSTDVASDGDDTDLWLYLILSGVGVQWIFVVLSNILPQIYNSIPSVLVLAIPVVAYLDTKRVYGTQAPTVWRSRAIRCVWTLALTVPIFNLSFAISYMFRRRERLTGIRANWSGIVTVALLISSVAFVGFGVADEGTVGIDIVGFWFLTGSTLMPLGVYYDSRYVSRLTDWPSYPLLWVVGAAVWFVNILFCPVYLYYRRKKTDALKAADDIAAVRESVEKTFANAERAADDGQYERAIDLATEAVDSLWNPEETDIDGRFESEGFEELRHRIEQSKSAWVSTVARQRIERGEQAAADGEYHRAIELATEAVQRLDQHDGPPVQGVVDQRERAERLRLDWLQAAVEDELSETEQAIQEGEHDRAIETCDRLVEWIESFEAGWTDGDSALRSVRHSVHEQRFEATEAKIRSILDSGADAAERGAYEEATQRAVEAVEQLQTTIDRAAEVGVDTASLQQCLQEARRQKFDCVESDARETLQAAEEAARNEDYETAIQRATVAAEQLQTTIDRAVEGGVDTDGMEALLERATDQRAEWERDALVERVNAAMDADPGDYDAASAELLAVLSEIPDTDVLSADERSLVEREARNAYVTVRTRGARALLEAGQQQLDDGEYEAARDRFSRVVDVVSETFETVAEWDGVDTDNLETLRAEAETNYVDTHVKLIEDVLDQGIEQFERGNYEQAQETFTEAIDRAVQARESIEDGRERLARLREIAEENVEAAQRASLGIGQEDPTVRRPDSTGGRDASPPATTPAGAVGRGSPAVIPAVTDLSITYDALERGDPIGKGGNADVYRATTAVDGTTHTLAIKEPRFTGTIGTSVVEEFTREAETWTKLDDHEHVVGVVDWGTSPLPWIAMEYMDGGDLSERLDSVGLEEGAWIAVVVTGAVLHAHRRGVAHLDLKPENILFRETDPDAWDAPKVGDWGLAKMLLDHSRSVEGVTPQYAAPEQFDDSTGVGQWTDIYQLGVVWYELFTGQPPFTGSPMEVVQQISDEPVTPPTEVDPSLPDALDETLLPALEKDPAGRYEDLLYFRDALEDVWDAL